jgi:hypothetical protein
VRRSGGEGAEGAEGELAGFAGLVLEGRRVLGEDRAHPRVELRPGARAEGDGLDELFGGARVVSGGDAVGHGGDPPAALGHERGEGGVVGEEGEERRLVRDDPAEEAGAGGGEAEGDRRAERVAGDPGRGEAEVLDERGEVGHVLGDAALARRPLAGAVPAAVVGDHSAAAGEGGDHGPPAAMRDP